MSELARPSHPLAHHDAPATDPFPRAFDPDHVGESIRQALGRWGEDTTGRAIVQRVHFARRGRIVVQYAWLDEHDRLRHVLHGEPVDGDAADKAAEESRRLRKPRRNQAAASQVDPVLALEAMPVLLRRAGHDAALPGLRLLHDADFRRHWLRLALGPAWAGSDVTVGLCAHRLGKRAVLRFERGTDAGRECRFARLAPVTHEGPRNSFDLHTRIHAALTRDARQKALQVPDPIMFDEAMGVALYGALPGRMAGDADLAAPARVDAAMCALNTLSNLSDVAAPVRASRAELDLLADWQERLDRFKPGLAASFGRQVGRLRTDFERLAPQPDAPCHRDLHEGQIMVTTDGTGLLDFDTFCLSDPDIDAGNLLAHLRWRERLCADGDLRASTQLVHRLVQSFGPSRAGRIAFWSRVSMLRICAIHAFSSEGGSSARGWLLGDEACTTAR
ncbi:MAG: phosphotransferase [Burkholderiaceae bacterium]